mmetsp:Transcript_22877/g.72442  ORF Transcript_22877/g.72442 Transcript_22877/m.72442 type:complete len:209 (+) Transcript_22877:83-709(+)
MIWQGSVLLKYTPGPKAMVLTGKHVQLNNSCESMFVVLSWSLFLSIVVAILNLTLALMSLIPCLVVLRDLVKVWMRLTGVFEAMVAIWGVTVISFQVREPETHACRDLYACAWWCFVGFLLLPAIVLLVSCLFLAGFATGAAAAREAGAARPTPQPTGTYGSNGTVHHPSGNVQPFSGQPHRLGGEESSPTSPKNPEARGCRPPHLGG